MLDNIRDLWSIQDERKGSHPEARQSLLVGVVRMLRILESTGNGLSDLNSIPRVRQANFLFYMNIFIYYMNIIV
jgi:hypothetical protein